MTVGIPAPPAPEGVLRLVKLGILTEADTGNFSYEPRSALLSDHSADLAAQ
ncbi:hypothetical protein AB0K80_31495 [Streptomyces sp. NPDC052682]|uniref:hypothetical protein n=1 Tax=Streptomyces sp. NPDC052682 TaxID=3154954 RepID=UPI0034438C8D